MIRWRSSKRLIRRVPGLLNTRALSDFPIFEPDKIRNFSIIAHVDHGKSTLADRLIELGGSVSPLPQQLDSLQVERERGITVKAQCASLRCRHDNTEYLLNLIDTPGHADFTHEVGRSLSLSDGAVLLVDATRGVQAQTVSHFYAAFQQEVRVIGAVNKIDAPRADVEACKLEMLEMFDLEESLVTCVSAKTGRNVAALLPQIIAHLPAPRSDPAAPFVGVLHDARYPATAGHVALTVFVQHGALLARDAVCFLSSGKSYPVREMGVFLPAPRPTATLTAGQIGYVVLKVRDVRDVVIGDTLCLPGSQTLTVPLRTVLKPKPSVFSGVFPDEETEFGALKESLEKLARSDTSVSVERDTNENLGEGWRLGFLGTLHREVFAERLFQEHGAGVIMTRPSITYRARLRGGGEVLFNSAAAMPDQYQTCLWEEPVVETTLLVPARHLDNIISYCMSCRGEQRESTALSQDRFLLKYHIPLVETVTDFYSSIKRLSSGYVSCDFEEAGFWETDLTKVDVLVNSQKVAGLSRIVRTCEVREVSRQTVQEVVKLMSRELYKIIVQCAVGSKIQARAEITPLRKDVTAHLYGGDETRAMKLLAQQRKGKKALKERAVIKIPKAVFRRF